MKPNTLLLILLFLPTLALPQVNIGRGRVDRLYQKHCATCHGNRGQGGLGGPLNGQEWQHAPDDDSKTKVIREGLVELGMQPYGEVLSPEQIRSLVIYIRELQTLANQEPPRPEADGLHKSTHLHFRLETVVTNPERMWGMTFLPDGQLLATEIDGRLRLIQPDGTLRPPVADTPKVLRFGQGGYLDIALDPDYAENGWVYLVYAQGENRNGMTSLVRGRIQDNRWTDEQVLFRGKPQDDRRAGQHFGSRIVFKDGYVFFAIGDRGAKGQAQDLNKPNGKIHRLHTDGRIPEDNPFVGKSAYPSIWSIGHRNPQAIAIRPGTGEIWSTEHGPRGGDELNHIQKGKNYGWPKVTFGMNYNGSPITENTHLPGMEPPVWHWTPSIATCGMAFVGSDRYPGWKGDLLAGGLRSEVIERLRIGETGLQEREVILQGQGRVRDIKEAPDGTLYIILDGNGSRIVRLVPEKTK